MLTAAVIGTYGEVHATAWLRANGWRCYRNTQLPGATDIEAAAGTRSLLVQVKTAIWPNFPASLSGEEKRSIVARANRNQKEAWLAQLQINREGALVGSITWTKLN
ncbi:MAG: hypothetical protein DMG35_17360 [Acidobacteria bacterium]|nr:MAG: hypothetical protein AUH86_00310 [Acidobacteria bacterium 13_1_40CM_4_58_4]PYT58532.1 MAG: hypothetical protein DMG35_17360 [Acidobacteriota bacterium]